MDSLSLPRSRHDVSFSVLMGMLALLEIYNKLLLLPINSALQGNDLQSLHHRKQSLDYTELARIILGDGGAMATQLFLALGQLGCLMVYTIFVSGELHYLIPTIPAWAWALLTLPWTLGMSQLRDISTLYAVSTVGLGCIAFVWSVVTIYCLAKLGRDGTALGVEAGWNLATFPEYFGIVFFSMEGGTALLRRR